MNRYRIWTAALFISLFLVGPARAAITYLHNDKDYAIATNLQALAHANAGGDSGLYDSMRVNLKLFATNEDDLIAQFARNFQDALALNLPEADWKFLTNREDRLKQKLAGFDTLLATNIQDYLDEQKIDKADAKTAAANIAQINAEIAAASSRIDWWNQITALYYDALGRLASTNPGQTNLIHSLNDAAAAAKKIKDLPLVYTASDGTKKTNTLGDEAIGFFKEVTGTNGPPMPPGATLEVLGLALDLAKIEKQKIQVRSDKLQARADLYREALVYDLLAKKLIDDFDLSPMPTNDLEFVSDIWVHRQTFITAGDAPAKLEAERYIYDRLASLRRLAIADFLVSYETASFEVALARIKHAESIDVSEQNDLMYRKAIARSSDVLAAYYKGGFTKEDLANVLRTAQSIALFIIAADVN